MRAPTLPSLYRRLSWAALAALTLVIAATLGRAYWPAPAVPHAAARPAGTAQTAAEGATYRVEAAVSAQQMAQLQAAAGRAAMHYMRAAAAALQTDEATPTVALLEAAVALLTDLRGAPAPTWEQRGEPEWAPGWEPALAPAAVPVTMLKAGSSPSAARDAPVTTPAARPAVLAARLATADGASIELAPPGRLEALATAILAGADDPAWAQLQSAAKEAGADAGVDAGADAGPDRHGGHRALQLDLLTLAPEPARAALLQALDALGQSDRLAARTALSEALGALHRRHIVLGADRLPSAGVPAD